MLLYVFGPIVVIFILTYLAYRSSGGATALNSLNDFDKTEDLSLIEIIIPKNDEEQVELVSVAAEHLFAALHGLLKETPETQEHIAFEIAADSTGVRFFMTAPNEIIKFVESQIYAQYPVAKLKVTQDYLKKEFLDTTQFFTETFVFERPSYYPIKIFRDFEIDPLSNLIATLADVKEGDAVCVQYLFKPIADGWQAKGRKYVEAVIKGVSTSDESLAKALTFGVLNEFKSVVTGIPVKVFRSPELNASIEKSKAPEVKKVTPFQDAEITVIENKLAKLGFLCNINVLCASNNDLRLQNYVRAINASYRQFTGTSLNNLKPVKAAKNNFSFAAYIKNRTFVAKEPLILTNEELATLFHLPRSRQETPSVSWVNSKTGEPPANLPTSSCNYIGETLFRGKKVRFGIKNDDDRLRHLYLIGKTGTGKSTFLENMIVQDIANGFGVGVLDPHGETIDKILDRIPDNRVEDVILFDPSDTERPIGLNLMEIESPSQKNLMASALLSAIKLHFDFSWGPRLEYLLNYALLTLLDVPGTTMLGVTRLLEDKNYLNFILHFVKDPVVIRFWETEFKEMKTNQKLITEAIAPIQNKVNRFLASTTIRNIVGQKTSSLDIWDAMNSGKILLMNLPKGKVGEDNVNLLGALLVSRIQFMALHRATLKEADRRPFYLFVDEFQNFATGSFESILSESRKYKLALHLTHQYTSQLPESLLKAVFGNVGTIAAFSLGAPDARVLASEFAPYFTDEDIISLEKFHIYIKLMIDGMTSLPFSAKILLPWQKETELVPKTGNREKVIEYSRQKYGVDRAYVEDKISKWVQTPFDKGMALAREARLKKEAVGSVVSSYSTGEGSSDTQI